MATLGSLNVMLTANTEPFRNALSRAAQSTARFSDSAIAKFKMVSNGFNSMVGFVGSAVNKLTTFATGNTFEGLVRGAFDSIDALAKMADRIGETPKRLAGLRHAAGLTGADTEKMNDALKDLGLKMGQVKLEMSSTGNILKALGSDIKGPTGKAIETLGLNFEEMIHKAPSEQILDIAENFHKLKTPAERAAVAVTFFGESGVKLVNMLSAGREGLKSMIDEVGGVSRIDAAKIENFNDAMARMAVQVKGVANKIAIALAPWLEAIVEKMTEWLKVGPMVNDGIAVIVEGMITAARVIGDMWDGATKLTLEFARGMEVVAAGTLWAFQGVANTVSAFGRAIGSDTLASVGSAVRSSRALVADMIAVHNRKIYEFENRTETTGMFLERNMRAIQDRANQAAAEVAAAGEAMRAMPPEVKTEVTQEIKQVVTREPIAALEKGSQAAITAILKDRDRQDNEAKVTAKENQKQTMLLKELVREAQDDQNMLKVARFV